MLRRMLLKELQAAGVCYNKAARARHCGFEWQSLLQVCAANGVQPHTSCSVAHFCERCLSWTSLHCKRMEPREWCNHPRVHD